MSQLNEEEYTRRVLARASTQWHGEKIDVMDLKEVLSEFIEAGNLLDRAKKALMYGREFHYYGDERDAGPPIQEATPPIPDHEQGIAHAILGVATEGVELVEALYAYLFENKQFDLVNLQEEFGDVNWYRTLGLHHVNQSHTENITQNDAKLETRFGPVEAGFTYKSANERDLEAERFTLEQLRASDDE